jgi:hypothetical protein
MYIVSPSLIFSSSVLIITTLNLLKKKLGQFLYRFAKFNNAVYLYGNYSTLEIKIQLSYKSRSISLLQHKFFFCLFQAPFLGNPPLFSKRCTLFVVISMIHINRVQSICCILWCSYNIDLNE